jgi:hypothetical protein
MSKDGLFDSYSKANEKAGENSFKKTETRLKPKMNIIKNGNWNSFEKERISTTLELAMEIFPDNLE